MANSDNKTPSSVHDLRSALELLKTLPGEYVETDTEVDPHAELSGVYRYVGAGGTCPVSYTHLTLPTICSV